MIDPRVKLRHIQCFLEVAKRKSLVRAADAMAVTQPAVSKTLKELEEIVDARLIDRSRSGVELTQYGEVFLQYASASLVTLKQGLDGVAHAQVSGESFIHIGVLPSVAARIIPDAVKIFHDESEDMILNLRTGPNTYLLEQMRQGELDLVVGRLADPDQMAGLSFEHLYSENVVFVVRKGHPLADLGSEALERIAEFPVLFPEKNAIIRPYVERLLISHGVSHVPRRVETVSNAFGRTFTLESDAVWIISGGVVARDIEQGDLIELPVDTTATNGPVGITHRADEAYTPGLVIFRRAIKKVVEQAGLK